jgi:hypothetical protein
MYGDFETVVNFFTTLLDEEQSMAAATWSHQGNVLDVCVNHQGRIDFRAGRGVSGGRGRSPGRFHGGHMGRGGRHAGRHSPASASKVTD